MQRSDRSYATARRIAARAALLVASPLLTLAGCEGVAWVAGIEPRIDHPGYQATARMARCHSVAIAEKHCAPERLSSAPGDFRVAFVGGSSVEGYPLGVPSFPSRMRARLERRWPGRFRVINLGLHCKDTLYVRACANRILSGSGSEADADAQLDLLVLYTGHNDFANWMGRYPRVPMFVEQNPWVLDLRDQLARTRTYSAAAALLRSFKVRPGHYERPPDAEFDASSRTILAAYLDHLRDILDRAADAGVPVLLVTLVSNIYEHPYVESEWDAGLADESQKTWGQWRLAFARGVAAHRAGRTAEALAAFKRARDVLPLGRVPSAVNDVLRGLAAEREGVDLVDFEAMLEAHADGEPIGCRYFGDVHAGKPWCDQFHPSQKTHDLLAAALAREVSRRMLERQKDIKNQ